MMMVFRGILRVKYRLQILLFLASTFAFGVWLFKGPYADREAELAKMTALNAPTGPAAKNEFHQTMVASDIDSICGFILVLASPIAAVPVIGLLPEWEREFLANQRREERFRLRVPILAAKKVENARKKEEHRAKWAIEREIERKERIEDNEKLRVYQEQEAAFQKEISIKRQDVFRKIRIDELARNAQTVEQDVKTEIVRKREEFLRRMALKAAEEDLILKREEASQHLTDRQIEQIVLRAFRRISSLASSEQDDAWDEWGADIAAEYDEYVTGEILAQAQELRNE